jgi:3-oxoacyl-[acyl-carrier-protein] synthase-1
MLALAISECCEGRESLVTSWPLLLCVAEADRPGRIDGLDDALLNEVQRDLGWKFNDAYSGVLPHGRVGAAVALLQARRLINEQQVDSVIIAGVDNLLARRTLRAFEAGDRLRTSRNSNGFIPGEAAAAVVVTAPARTSRPQLICAGLGFSVERATVSAEHPLRGDGLTQAITAALADAGCSLEELDFRITDNSGEQYYFKESALALARTLRAPRGEFDIWHPADCIGEVGAAIGPVVLNVALAASRKGYAP